MATIGWLAQPANDVTRTATHRALSDRMSMTSTEKEIQTLYIAGVRRQMAKPTGVRPVMDRWGITSATKCV